MAVKLAVEVWGYLVCMCSSAFFLSPSPTFNTIIRNQSVGEFSVAPYVIAVLNCAFMIMNGFVNDNMLVITIFAMGCMMELAYVAIFLYYANSNAKRKIAYCLCGGSVFFVTYSLVFHLALQHPSQKKIAFGVISIVFNIAMYGFPLKIMNRVMNTGSVDYMPFWLTLATFPHATVWMVYGFIKNDYHAIGNAIGFLLGVFQMVLYGHFRNPAAPAAPAAPADPADPALADITPAASAAPAGLGETEIVMEDA